MRCFRADHTTAEKSGGGTRTDVRGREVKHRSGHLNGVALAPGQKSGVFGQLPRVDVTGGDATQRVVRASQLFSFAVLAAG